MKTLTDLQFLSNMLLTAMCLEGNEQNKKIKSLFLRF